MKKAKAAAEIAFLIVGTLTVLEFVFVRGMFTWAIATAAVCVTGLLNIVLSAASRNWREALLYLLCSAALCMGYLTIAGV